MSPKILPGRANPLGATPTADGTNFAVSSGGDEVSLCLFDADGVETRLVLPERDGDTRHGFVPGVIPGQAYGFRVSGPYDPPAGCATTRPNCCWTPTPARSRVKCGLAPKSLEMQPITQRLRARWTRPLTCRAA